MVNQRSKRLSPLTRGLMNLPGWLDSLLPRQSTGLSVALVILVLLLSIPFIVTPIAVWQQGLIAVGSVALGWGLIALEERQRSWRASEHFHMLLMWVSIITTLRYLFYRISYTLNFSTALSTIFTLVLFGAELYAITTLLLSYFQVVRVRDRQPIPISHLTAEHLPAVDIYIPTYNEAVDIVRRTALAALAVDYPAERLNVFVLDDGRKYPERRVKLAEMCRELGCALLTRPDNEHAKAGNINTALPRTPGELVLILDCDHIPSKQILQHTVGFFLGQPKVSLVQTPHWFYNPDPFERNLLTHGRVPVGNELFYKLVQKGNDFWNATFFCGSAAVIRKDHLLEVGGIAVETVTEDCHTALRLHQLGYETVYYDKIMVAGLAPDTFSSYVGQQIRWARGMAQILRLEMPMFNWRLSLPQRLCYLSATSHFFYGFPRIVYAIAPVIYLLFGINPVRGLGVETLAYALPHIILSLNANFIAQKGVRFSFWNEIFEYSLAFRTGIVTLMAVINPKLGSFNVTEKGTSVTKRNFDIESSRITLALIGLLICSLLMVPFGLALRTGAQQAVWINALWCVFNLIMLVAALTVAIEQPQMRQAHRLDRKLEVQLYSGDLQLEGRTLNISESGAQIELETWPNLPDMVTLVIHGDFKASVQLDAEILRVNPLDDNQVLISVRFADVTDEQFDRLVLVIYSDVEEWYSQQRSNTDRPFASLGFMATSFMRAFENPKAAASTTVTKRIQAQSHIYWNGQFYPAVAMEMNSRKMCLMIDLDQTSDLLAARTARPSVGLLVETTSHSADTIRLVARLGQIISERDDPAISPGQAVVELEFPSHLDPRQGYKIKQLLETL
ncbi:MAG: UDP-forming cellulose synthase catalytic subunit [Cyanobacteria bacterium P01_A01_bin.135]